MVLWWQHNKITILCGLRRGKMKIKNTYRKLNKVEYSFSKQDILKALSNHFKIKVVNEKYDFSIFEELDDAKGFGSGTCASLVVSYEEPREEK